MKNLKEQNIESITSKNDYVLNHDYGYNQEHELAELKRLKLRNIIDLKDYLIQAVEDMFYAEFNCWIVKFLNNKLKTKIFIEEIN